MYGSTSPSATAKTALLPKQSKDRRREFSIRRKNRRASARGDASVLGTVLKSKRALVEQVQSESFRRNAVELTASSAAPAPASPASPHRRPRSFIFTLLNPYSKQWQALLFKKFIVTVILVDVILFILSTDHRIRQKYDQLFQTTEAIVSSIFLLEYILRLVTAVERPKYQDQFGRLRYLVTPAALLDLCATAPFFVEALTGLPLPTLTHLRIFRLFRILKTAAIVQALDAVYRVIYYNSEILQVALLICTVLVLVTAVLLYYLRPPGSRQQGLVDVDDFHSIPATLYLSTLMLTGQGGPEDAGDLPWYTRCVVLATAVFSVAMFAIPASMLTWGFEAEAERMAKHARRRALRQANRSQDSSTSSEDSGDTDEEYFRIIAGEEEDDDDDSEQAKEAAWREMQSFFSQADHDGDGTLNMAELWKMRGVPSGSIDDSESAKRMAHRIQELEARTRDNTQKLDRILEMLQQKKGLFR